MVLPSIATSDDPGGIVARRPYGASSLLFGGYGRGTLLVAEIAGAVRSIVGPLPRRMGRLPWRDCGFSVLDSGLSVAQAKNSVAPAHSITCHFCLHRLNSRRVAGRDGVFFPVLIFGTISHFRSGFRAHCPTAQCERSKCRHQQRTGGRNRARRYSGGGVIDGIKKAGQCLGTSASQRVVRGQGITALKR